MRPCDVCGKPYEAKRPNSRFCGASCRKRNERNPATVAEVVPLEPEQPAGLVEATRRELEAADRLDTVLGHQALELARRIVSPMSTGSSVATLSRELRTVMTEATAGAVLAADPLDELRARRDRLRASG
jgi:hypothetical protein